MYSNRRSYGTKPCWNGPGCRYLAQGNCHFYHPETHNSTNRSNNRHTLPRRESSPEIDFHSIALNIFKEQIRKQREKEREEREERTKLQAERFKKLMEGLKKNETQENKLILNGRTVTTIPKASLLITDSNRQWFFKNSHHFRYFPGCCFDECSICLEKYTVLGDTLTYFFCKHAFHTKCIENWLKTNSLCPLCKQDFKKHK